MENKRKQQRNLHLEDYTSYFHYGNAADLGFMQSNQVLISSPPSPNSQFIVMRNLNPRKI